MQAGEKDCAGSQPCVLEDITIGRSERHTSRQDGTRGRLTFTSLL